MDYKNIKIVTFLFSFLCSICYAQENNLVVEIDPVKSFKDFLTNHFESYKTDRREQLSKLGGGWVKEYF